VFPSSSGELNIHRLLLHTLRLETYRLDNEVPDVHRRRALTRGLCLSEGQSSQTEPRTDTWQLHHALLMPKKSIDRLRQCN